MIKLKFLLNESKLILNEQKAPITDPFTLGDGDPYEYYFNLKDKQWYTKRKNEQKWNLMKDIASNYDKAVRRLLKGPRFPTRQVIDKTDDTEEIDNKPKQKYDLGIKRDNLGYIISGKSSVYGKTFTLRSNLNNASVVILKQIDIDDVDRKTGIIDHNVMDAVATLYPEETKYYTIGDIKTVTMPIERGMYSKDEDPNSGNKFTYLYIVGTNGYKGFIPSNTVKINS